MKKLLTILLVAVSCHAGQAVAANHSTNLSGPKIYNGARYNAGVAVFKVNATFKNACLPTAVALPALDVALQKIGATSVTKKFPHAYFPEAAKIKSGGKPVDLSLVYQVSIPSNADMHKVVAVLMRTGVLEYAEPLYIHEMSYTPNDPQASSQYQLTKINAYNAWNVWQGDTNTVVGIVDSGTDWDHPDLQANVKYNYADPIDGIDNDNDGFIDNFRGWDVSENDNNPMVVNSTHGSHVSGCADAVTDNGVGVAGPAFRCKFLPVKSCLDASATSIDNGYDGVVYAADHGASVINCSWGRAGGPSSFEQDIVNYATFNRDALMVVAAGNNYSEEDYYPSAYENVISVAATTNTDAKAGFSNYGYSIDVCAPGNNILATVYNDTYTTMSGTSMASPIAAGCATMIRSRFPSLNALQTGMQLRNTCDNIYAVSGNVPLVGKLGKGRVNLYRALTDSVSPGVIVKRMIIHDENDDVFVATDTLNMQSVLWNLLRPTTNLLCTLSTTSTYVTVLNNGFPAGAINTFDSVVNSVSPFRAVINAGAPTNTEVTFKIHMVDGTWTNDYFFKVTVNVDYLNIQINDVGSSVTSRSLIGYNTTGQAQGIGFTYKNSATILYEMGLMIGASGTQVSDNVRGDAATYDSDWSPSVTIRGTQPGVISDYDATSYYSDNGTTSTAPLNLLVRQNSFAWVNAPDNKYIMMQYFIKNVGTATYTGLYAGIFADWDVPSYANNKGSVDLSRRLGYVWSTDTSGIWAGIQLLSHTGGFTHYAADNITGGGGGLDISAGFTAAQKYTTLSTSRDDSGTGSTTGNDVLEVVSSGGFTLAPGDSVEVAFALMAGDSLTDLQSSADAAQIRYDATFTGISQVAPVNSATALTMIYPNPASGELKINFSVAEASTTEIAIYSATGEKVKVLINEGLLPGKFTLTSDVSLLASGNYVIRMTSGTYSKGMPLNIVR